MSHTPATPHSDAGFVTKFVVLVLLTVPALLVGSAAFVALIVLGDFSSFGTGQSGEELSRAFLVGGATTLLVAYYAVFSTLGTVVVVLPAAYLMFKGMRLPSWLGSTLLVIISIAMAVQALLVTSGVVSPFGVEAFAPGVLDKSPEFWTYTVVAGAVTGLVFYYLARSIRFLRQ